MARKRNIYRTKKRRAPSPLGPSLVIVAAALVVGLAGGYFWQKLSGDEVRQVKQRQLLTLANAAESGSAIQQMEPEEGSLDAASKPGSCASSEPESSSRPDEKESSEAGPSEKEEGSTGETGQPASPVTASSSSAVVPESERVRSDYFDDAMFVGDSITSGILSYDLMQNTTVIAHTGINPDTIRYKEVYRDASGDLITMLDAMAQHPDVKKIYIMLGSNGIAWMEREPFLKFYEEFLRSAMEQHPDAILYVESILPVTQAKSDGDPAYANSRIDSFNQGILEMTERLGLHYINVAEAFKDENGALPTEASPNDGMHFGPKYYQKWFDYLKTHTVAE